MKILSAILLLTVFSVYSGDFHDLRVRYNQIESYYKNLSEIKESSPRHDDFEKRLKAFQESAIAIQQVTDAMPCMDDIQFARYAEMMLKFFKSSGVSRKAEKESVDQGSVFRATEIPFNMMLELLESDIQELLDIKFRPAAKEKTIHSAELYPEFYQFRRFLRYYRAVSSKIKDYAQNLAWRNMFSLRMKKMKDCAAKLRTRMEEDFPEILRRYDPVFETDFLVSYYYENQPDSLSDRGTDKKTLKGRLTAKTDNPKRDLRQNMSFSARRLNHMCQALQKELKKLDQEFESAQAEEQREARKQQKDKKKQELREAQEVLRESARQKKENSSRAEKSSSSEKRTVSLDRMSESELRGELENRRAAVFPSDGQQTLEKGQYDSCRATLSKDQQDMLESIRLRHVRAGEKEQKAEIESLRELRPLLETKNLSLNKKEMLQLLKAGEPKD